MKSAVELWPIAMIRTCFMHDGARRFRASACSGASWFTGKERDSESGLDNFGARYNASNLGRFMTPDWSARATAVPYAVFGDPQSLNLYGYVRNDPVSRADADGHIQSDPGGDRDRNLTEQQTDKAEARTAAAENASNTMQYGKGGGKIALGIGLVATAAVGDAPGGVAGALILTSAVLGGTVTTVSGVTDVVGVATKTDVHEAQEALDATSNLPGLAVTAASGGNLKAGQTAATIGDAASLAMSPKEATKNLATAVDAGRTVFSTGGLLKSAWNSFSSAVSGAFAPSPGPPVVQTVPGPPQ